MIGIQAYVQLPLCIDQQGHRFTIPPTSSKAVCGRCGLIREQPTTVTNSSEGVEYLAAAVLSEEETR